VSSPFCFGSSAFLRWDVGLFLTRFLYLLSFLPYYVSRLSFLDPQEQTPPKAFLFSSPGTAYSSLSRIRRAFLFLSVLSTFPPKLTLAAPLLLGTQMSILQPPLMPSHEDWRTSLPLVFWGGCWGFFFSRTATSWPVQHSFSLLRPVHSLEKSPSPAFPRNWNINPFFFEVVAKLQVITPPSTVADNLRVSHAFPPFWMREIPFPL